MRRDLYAFLVLNVLYLHAESAVSCVKPDWFQCDNGRCLMAGFECDGEDDCGDNTDERNCSNPNHFVPPVQCATDEYHCKDEACIPIEKFCDAKPDCSDASDEYAGCVRDLKCSTFRCKDGHCIKNEWVCDGTSDCPDKSDEMNCENRPIIAAECTNDLDRYLCNNSRCIPLSSACDKKNDCGDGSDENYEKCAKADTLCRTAKCEHYCRRTPEGAMCSCRIGYKLSTNETCTDVNECENHGVCDQRCTNNAGSYSCACRDGYTLEDDKKTCTAEGGEALMIFSVRSEIRGLYLKSQVYFPVTRNLQHAVGVSLDANYIYWSDIEDGNEAIIRSHEDGSHREVIVTTGLSTPDELAVDWVTGNIYFSDSGYMHIGVCTNDGSFCTVVIKDRNDKPRGLALVPSNGIMYWSEWGREPRILLSGMDGKNTSEFVTDNLAWPSGLTIDYANNRLYWVDAKLKIIQSINLNGSDRRIVLKDTAKKPFSLAVFENKLYWSDWSSNTIQSCDKFTGKDWQILVRENRTVYGIHIYHSVLKPKIPNPCNSKPCSQLCLLNRNNSYTCACALDKELNFDQHTCRTIKKKQHLVIAGGNTFIYYYHELLGKPKMTRSTSFKHVTALAYDSLTGSVLASDQLTDNIFRIDTSTDKMDKLISLKTEILGGMDFDYIGNNLYISNLHQKTIEVYSLNTDEKTVFYFREQPQDIALVPEEGLMFVVFRSADEYRVDRMKMSGIGPRTTIAGYKNSLQGPKISLCYDKELKRIFWSDQGSGRILSTAINGSDTYLFRTGLFEPVSLAVLDNHVFWTQSKSRKLYWADKTSIYQYQKGITLDMARDVDMLHLKAIQGTYVNNNHGCRKSNGNCSHVCLVSNAQSHICACPPDMMLSSDNRTCTKQTACKPGELKCGEHDVCIEFHQRCDGKRDCPNGEDESSVCGELNSCKADEFSCKNGDCISSKKRCNSHYDCEDKSDEDGCDAKECKNNQFQCHEGGCVSQYMVCNGNPDCPDNSDEFSCGEHTCSSNDFTCDSRMCIPDTWQCDGQNDCDDGSDEGEKCQKACPAEMFVCHNGRCIDPKLKCNGKDDCQDNSDERYCSPNGNVNLVNCTEDKYRCYNTDICLPKAVKCNGVQDCPKNDDERDCVSCERGEFVCGNRKCIPQTWVCDMTDDCGDKSDERDCSGEGSRKSSVSVLSNCKEFKCKNGACLPFSKVCDEIPDCADRSDEFEQCAVSCTKDNPCEHMCHKTPLGPTCSCRSGFRLSADEKSCEDVDECEHNVCSQICHNNVGSFICSCHDGYVLRNDRTSCKVAGSQMELITVTENSIRKMPATLTSVEIVVEELNYDVTGIDVNAEKEAVYWSTYAMGMISKISMKSGEKKMVTGVGRPEALAVDWITDNVYFNDNDQPASIKVCNLDEQRCAKLVTLDGRSRATSLAVDPQHGWLFWSQVRWEMYNSPTSEIYRSDTTGSNMTTIAHRNVGVYNEITIDHMRSRLYWGDSFLKTIQVSNLDGSNRATYMETGIYQPLSINIYEDSLYWLMGTTGNLQRCNLHGEKSCSIISIGSSSIGNSFAILHATRQPIVKNTCENHKCDYMCVLRSNDYACICENGNPVGTRNVCGKSSNGGIKFNSGMDYQKDGNIRRNSGPMIGLIATVVICIVVLGAYYYCIKLKPQWKKQNNLSIHFQNPSFERRNEIITTFDHVTGLPPGEHEYTNPVTNLKNGIQRTDGKKLVEFGYTEQSDYESDDSGCKPEIRLI